MCHTFDRNKKITKVECIIHEYEWYIMRINFYSGQETLIKVLDNDEYVKRKGGRVESFEIASDERLIGCKIDIDNKHYHGVTWLKMKVRF